jgi:hypothetical protein
MEQLAEKDLAGENDVLREIQFNTSIMYNFNVNS